MSDLVFVQNQRVVTDSITVADTVDYIIAVRSSCKNVDIEQCDGKNVSISEVRTESSYTPPKENEFSAKRKGGVLYNPHWTTDNPPDSGEWRRGDIIYNPHPIAGGYIGIICVDSGTPGRWKDFGEIAE